MLIKGEIDINHSPDFLGGDLIMSKGIAKVTNLGEQGLVAHTNAPNWDFIYEVSTEKILIIILVIKLNFLMVVCFIMLNRQVLVMQE